MGAILVNPDQALPLALPEKAFYALFREGPRNFKTKLRLVAPSGKQIGEFRSRHSKKPEETLAVMVNFPMMIFEELGTYRAEVLLDDKQFDFEYSLGRSQLPLNKL